MKSKFAKYSTKYNGFTILILVVFLFLGRCSLAQIPSPIQPGANSLEEYLPLLNGKRIAMVVNQTSMVNNTSLVDTLSTLGINIQCIFAPEHGFRGLADAGEKINNSIDQKTGIKIISLYGKNYKPLASDLKNIDIMLFDIQDVGVRFYTYISTLHYVMEACAENKIPIIVLDRPNPNGSYIAGPILKKEFQSFVGMHPVPIVYGMTIGEYALMINGEGWLKDGLRADLQVVRNKNYTCNSSYILPIKPSPNLPNELSIFLYPSLCLFEGTVISVGRGTEFPFQVFGNPKIISEFFFTPKSISGMSVHPPFENEKCYGIDLRNYSLGAAKKFDIRFLINAYKSYPDKDTFFNSFFEKLAGNAALRKQIINGESPKRIEKSWEDGLEDFRKVRSKYLLYN